MTVGNFDGLHRGHQALLQMARAEKARHGGLLVVYSFDPHPQAFFKAPGEHALLEKRSVWRERLAQSGVDILIEEKFTKEFSQLSAEEFLARHWAQGLNLKSLTVGSDFRFGRNRQGDQKLLESWSRQRGLVFHAVAPVIVEGERVSTSRIKALLREGQVLKAQNLLGRPFSIKGEVQKGDQRGRTLGFPTLNLVEESANLLRRGVYVASVDYKGKSFFAVTNVGVRPTLHSSSQVVVESHLLGTSLNEFYGQMIEVQFQDFVRDEKKFSGLDELRQQIQEDIRKAQEKKKL
ncbi:MAG: riboflavin biosynthesis protein RibF [Bdellovibrionales bacterium]